MKRFIPIFLLGLLIPGQVFAQAMFSANEAVVWTPGHGASPPFPLILTDTQPLSTPNPKEQLPAMSAELALATYQQRVAQQAKELASYSAVMVVRAELPGLPSKVSMSCSGGLRRRTACNSRRFTFPAMDL